MTNAVGPNDRRQYMRERRLRGIDWSFSLSANDIIKSKIPPDVAGSTGRAKVFCKLAHRAGLDCFVVTTVRVIGIYLAKEDRKSGRKERIVNGHQIIAVRDEKTGTLRAFDPGNRKLHYIDSNVHIGADINFNFRTCKNTAILSPDAYNKIIAYQGLRDAYVNGATDYSKSSAFKRTAKKQVC